jgi:hypothetical protein
LEIQKCAFIGEEIRGAKALNLMFDIFFNSSKKSPPSVFDRICVWEHEEKKCYRNNGSGFFIFTFTFA